MKQHLRQNWKYYVSPVLLACLLLAGLWYWRGVGFAAIAEDILPDSVSVYVSCLDENGKQVSAHYEVEAGSPEGREILKKLYSLTIHRPPTNLLYQILKPSASGAELRKGDYVFVLRVFGAHGGQAALQFGVNSWSYDGADGRGYLPCTVEDGEAMGRELGALLWKLNNN